MIVTFIQYHTQSRTAHASARLVRRNCQRTNQDCKAQQRLEAMTEQQLLDAEEIYAVGSRV